MYAVSKYPIRTGEYCMLSASIPYVQVSHCVVAVSKYPVRTGELWYCMLSAGIIYVQVSLLYCIGRYPRRIEVNSVWSQQVTAEYIVYSEKGWHTDMTLQTNRESILSYCVYCQKISHS